METAGIYVENHYSNYRNFVIKIRFCNRNLGEKGSRPLLLDDARFLKLACRRRVLRTILAATGQVNVALQARAKWRTALKATSQIAFSLSPVLGLIVQSSRQQAEGVEGSRRWPQG